MYLNRYISPYSIKVDGNRIKVDNKNGLTIMDWVKVKKLGDRRLLQMAYGTKGVVRNQYGEITEIIMYERGDQTHDHSYLFRYKVLGNLTENQIA
jgi:hypothetical protein